MPEVSFLKPSVDDDGCSPRFVWQTILVQVEPFASLQLTAGLLNLKRPPINVQAYQPVVLDAAIVFVTTLVIPEWFSIGCQRQGIVA